MKRKTHQRLARHKRRIRDRVARRHWANQPSRRAGTSYSSLSNPGKPGCGIGTIIRGSGAVEGYRGARVEINK